MNSSFVIGKIAGIEIGIHYSWLFAFVIITVFLGMSVYPSSYPHWSDVTHWAVGAVTAFALFVSVLAHELAHSFVALAKGIRVRSITLFIFGGASNLATDTQRPGDEFQISIAGPLTSLLIGGLALFASRSMAPVNPRDTLPLDAMLFYLGWMNLGVGVFNLLPGLPLDGGRVLRSIVWQATGKVELATIVAGRAGQIVGWAIVAYGVYVMFIRDNIFNGLWFAMIGWFLAGAASSAIRQARRRKVEGPAADVQVRQVMRPNPVVVGPDLSVYELVNECFRRLNCSAAPVLDGQGLYRHRYRGGRADGGRSRLAASCRPADHGLEPGDSQARRSGSRRIGADVGEGRNARCGGRRRKGGGGAGDNRPDGSDGPGRGPSYHDLAFVNGAPANTCHPRNPQIPVFTGMTVRRGSCFHGNDGRAGFPFSRE